MRRNPQYKFVQPGDETEGGNKSTGSEIVANQHAWNVGDSETALGSLNHQVEVLKGIRDSKIPCDLARCAEPIRPGWGQI